MTDYTWAKIFIEVSLRAIRRVHFDFGLWAVGHQWLAGSKEVSSLNVGHGIELADESTVCAAITQELVNSQFLTGVWTEGSDGLHSGPGERYYLLEREYHYMHAPRCRADMCSQVYVKRRVDQQPQKDGRMVYVEAKRGHYWTSRVSTGAALPGKQQLREIQRDIERLRREIKYRDKHQEEPIYGHVLVWDIYRKAQDSPSEFFHRLGDEKVKVHQVRWLPLSWQAEPIQGNRETSMQPPPIACWLWVALAEVLG